MDEPITPERAARNQALFREINERTEPLNEAAAATPTYFAVAPNDLHVVPEVEQIVGKPDRYWIVEKVGTAGRIAVNDASGGGIGTGETA